MWVIQTLQPYIQETNYTVYPDRALLRWLLEISEPNGRLMSWRMRLKNFDIDIWYMNGLLNTRANVFSPRLFRGDNCYD